MENLPPSLKGRRYYKPGDQGFEKEVADQLKRWWGEGREEDVAQDSHPPPNA